MSDQIQPLRENRDRLEREWQALQKATPADQASIKIIEYTLKKSDPLNDANEWSAADSGGCCTIM